MFHLLKNSLEKFFTAMSKIVKFIWKFRRGIYSLLSSVGCMNSQSKIHITMYNISNYLYNPVSWYATI